VSGADTGASTHRRAKDDSIATGVPLLVLIVDDEGPIAESLAFMVEDEGFPTMVAKHGREALEMAQTRWPALVFTDLMMPHMNGTNLIAALRATAAEHGYPTPPCILMTAAGSRPAEAAGADVVLHKPFDLTEVEDLLTRFLR